MEDEHGCDKPLGSPEQPDLGWTDLKKDLEPWLHVTFGEYFKEGKTMRQAGASQSMHLKSLVWTPTWPSP